MYSRPMGDYRNYDNSGYWTLRYWTPQAAIGYRQGNTRRNIAEHRTDYGNSSVIRCCDQRAQNRVRQSGKQLFLSSDSKYTRREPLTERLSLHIRACARVLYYCLSACHKSNSRRNFGGLSAKIIKHDHVVLNTQ